MCDLDCYVKGMSAKRKPLGAKPSPDPQAADLFERRETIDNLIRHLVAYRRAVTEEIHQIQRPIALTADGHSR